MISDGYEYIMYKLALQKIDNPSDVDVLNTEIEAYKHALEKINKSIIKIQRKTSELENIVDKMELLENLHVDVSKTHVHNFSNILKTCISEIFALSEKRYRVSGKLQKLIEKKAKILKIDDKTLEEEINKLGESPLTLVLKMENQQRSSMRERLAENESDNLIDKYRELEGSKTYKKLLKTKRQ